MSRNLRRSLSCGRFSKKEIIDYLDEIKKSKNNIVLFGRVGVGKTTLLNRLCDRNYQTADSGYSCTRKVQYAFSMLYNMIIIDFPGLNATKDIVNHLKTQLISISNIPVRMICFLVENSTRNDDFEREISQMLSIFYNYIANISIIITKTENMEMIRKEELKLIFKNRFGINNIFFTSEVTNFYGMLYDLNEIQLKMNNIEKITIKTRDIAKTIPSLYNKDVIKERENYEKQFDDALDIFENEINKTTDDDLKKAIYFCFKYFKQMLLENYKEELCKKKINGKEMEMDDVIAEVLMFSNKIYNEFEDFKKKIESQIEIKINNYNGEYNKFKKCPHCGLIWFKVKGCDSVQCGKRTRIRDLCFGRFKNYIVSYINKIISIVTRDSQYTQYENDCEFYGLTEQEKNINIEREKEGKKKIQPLGCGASLNWCTMEDCSEEMIKKLKDISLDNEDYYSAFFKDSEK